MPDIKTKSRNSSKVNSRNYSTGPLKSANRAKFRNVSAEETGTTGSPTAENENHQPDNNNQHNGKSFFIFYKYNFMNNSLFIHNIVHVIHFWKAVEIHQQKF